MTELDDANAESLWLNLQQLERRLRLVEDRFDTRETPLWRRLVFRLDGWPSWVIVADRPAWRPWRRWWTS